MSWWGDRGAGSSGELGEHAPHTDINTTHRHYIVPPTENVTPGLSNSFWRLTKSSRTKLETGTLHQISQWFCSLPANYLVQLGGFEPPIHSQLSSPDTTRQIRSLASREHLLFLDFYHHVGNCQRHDPTRPDAGSVLPPRYRNSVRLEPPSCQVVEVPMTRTLSVISVRGPGCGRAPGELAQLARSGGDPQLLEPGARQAAAEAWSPTFVYGILFKALAETVLSRPTQSTLEPALA
jgi:hypothetical protein